MISSGENWKRLPKGLRKNLEWRKSVLGQARGSRELQRSLWLECRKDLLFFVNMFVWQFNPKARKGLEAGPFITYGYQDVSLLHILKCIEDGEDLVMEKSRQMGASWMLLIAFLWLFLFHENQTFLCISRNEKSVEDENPNSLFWKLDYMLKYLPDWMKPRGLVRRKMYFGNEELNSTIFGEASTGQANVGGNTTAMMVDEFAQIREGREVLHRTSDSTKCRIFNSTHMGPETPFAELCDRPDIRKLVMHWTEHPVYSRGMYRWDEVSQSVVYLEAAYKYALDFVPVTDGSPLGGPHPGLRSPWYDKQCDRKTDSRAVAIDLDINPRGSVSQFFQPDKVRSLIARYAVPATWVGDVSYDRETGEPLGMIPAEGGPLRLWCILNREGKPPTDLYAAGADVAAGSGATPSCLSLGSRTTGEKILEYTNAMIEPREFAFVAVAICWWFCDAAGDGASIAWEKIGPGSVFGKWVISLGYRSVYMNQNESGSLLKIIGSQPGWSPTGTNKRTLLEDYRSALYRGSFTNRSKEALEETMMFKYTPDMQGVKHGRMDSDDPSRGRENHADMVIADALCCRMMGDTALGLRPKKEEKEIPVGSLEWRKAIHEQLGNSSSLPWSRRR